MKKHSLITQTLIWSIVLVVAGGTLIYAVGHELVRGTFAFGNEPKESNLIAVSKETIRSEEIKEINIDLVSQALNIYSTEDAEIRIEHKANRALTKREKLIISIDGDRLTIKKPRRIGINLISREIVDVYIPEQYEDDIYIDMTSEKTQIENIKLENLILEKTSGSTAIEDIEVKKLSTDITSGSLEITNSQIENLISDGTSGSVKIENITSQVIELEKTSGSVKIKGTCQELDVNSTSGSIDIRLENMPQKIKTVQTSGSNKIELPENDGFELYYHKTSGNLTSDFLLNGQNKIRESGTYLYKDGSNKIDIKTTSGSTTLSKR